MSTYEEGKRHYTKSLVKCDDCGTERTISKSHVNEGIGVKYCRICSQRGDRSCHKGKHLTEEHRKKISNSTKGENHSFFGKHHSEETKQKLREANLNKEVSEETRKKLSLASSGEKNPNYGKKHSEATKAKISLTHKGKIISEESKRKMSLAAKGRIFTEEHKRKLSIALSSTNNPNYGKYGEESPNWNENLTKQDRKDRRGIFEYKDWCLKIKQRDNWKCQITEDDIGGNLIAHHFYNWTYYPEKRFDINNGITLREDIHILFHMIFGWRHNTTEQFEIFKQYMAEVLNV